MLLAVVQGGILVAATLGVLGVLRSWPLISILGATMMFSESIPLIFSFAPLTVLASGLLLLAARETAPLQGAAGVGARLLGSVAGIAILQYLRVILTRGGDAVPPLLLILMVLLIFVAVVGWWPGRHQISGDDGQPS